nr:helitron helicase-like domain-containing protein [Tanacetum cinerariifolium]
MKGRTKGVSAGSQELDECEVEGFLSGKEIEHVDKTSIQMVFVPGETNEIFTKNHFLSFENGLYFTKLHLKRVSDDEFSLSGSLFKMIDGLNIREFVPFVFATRKKSQLTDIGSENSRRKHRFWVSAAVGWGASPSYDDLGDCDQQRRHCGAAFCYGECLKGHSYNGWPDYHLCYG